MLDECNNDARFDIYCDFERPGLVEATLDKRKWVDSEFRSGATDFTVRYLKIKRSFVIPKISLEILRH